eukprot:9645049-Karenia_brevis.AAC.1
MALDFGSASAGASVGVGGGVGESTVGPAPGLGAISLTRSAVLVVGSSGEALLRYRLKDNPPPNPFSPPET